MAALTNVPTIRQALNEGARALREAAIAEDRRTASLLLEHASGWSRERLISESEREIPSDCYESYLELIRRRALGEPAQYITGHQEFYGLDFVVTPDVLIPRPETEFLVERVFELARVIEDPVIVDLGTGSGCVAVTLAVNLPRARVIATDISARALAVAKANAERHRVAAHIEFGRGDMLGPLEEMRLGEVIDIVASNPPYVPTENAGFLQREVRDFEPGIALYGGPDGLGFYRSLLIDSQSYLKPGGSLVCEIGFSQLEAVSRLIDPVKWGRVDFIPDLQGIPRILTLAKQ